MLFLLRGVDVAPELAEWLCNRVGEPTATTIRDALYGDRGRVRLGVDDQRLILRALDDADEVPDGLEPLRTLIRLELQSRDAEDPPGFAD